MQTSEQQPWLGERWWQQLAPVFYGFIFSSTGLWGKSGCILTSLLLQRCPSNRQIQNATLTTWSPPKHRVKKPKVFWWIPLGWITTLIHRHFECTDIAGIAMCSHVFGGQEKQKSWFSQATAHSCTHQSMHRKQSSNWKDGHSLLSVSWSTK